MSPDHSLLAFSLACVATLSSCSSSPAKPDDPGSEPLGSHSFPITTTSPVAQRYFDRGLTWCYAFHHVEATKSFRAALAADPGCAMAQWGLAYAAGPHINNMEMSEESAKAANEDAQKALAFATGITPFERALIEALTKRYAWPAPKERKTLDQAYADAMREVYRSHPDQPDVAALFAESLMDLRPWDLWSKTGEPRPETPEIVSTLEKLIAKHPNHPQALHLYIHAVEASPQPERAIAAADRLGALVPGAGHLVHMPSHAYIRVGRWEDAAEANRRGIAADKKIVARTGRTGFYEIYRAHNYHFLAYAAMFEGRADEAIATSRELVKELPEDIVKAMPNFLDGFVSVPYHALVRFGKWEQMLQEPEPPKYLPVTRATWHYGRGVALAALGRVPDAEKERTAFDKVLAAVPDAAMFGNNPAKAVLGVGQKILEGEVELRAGHQEAAFAALREAVKRDDELAYSEPWDWMTPARHPLGALLVEAGQFREAREVYQMDLLRHPENGWSLHGLAECNQRLGDNETANAVDARLKKAWSRADVQLVGSCYCRKK